MEDLNNWQEKFEVCIYAKKLLDKVEYLNNVARSSQTWVDINEVKKAIYYARKYHGSQMRQSGEPFYSHPIEVAYMLLEYTALYAPRYFRTDILVIALLHDTIEDTELTKEIISCIFGDKVAGQVQALTRIKPEGKISSAEMLNKLYKEKNHDALLVKLFDRLHNMQTISAKSPDKIKKTIAETLLNFVGLSIYLQDCLAEFKDLSTKLFSLDTRINNLCYTSIMPKTKQVIIRKLLDGCEYHLPDIYIEIY